MYAQTQTYLYVKLFSPERITCHLTVSLLYCRKIKDCIKKKKKSVWVGRAHRTLIILQLFRFVWISIPGYTCLDLQMLYKWSYWFTCGSRSIFKCWKEFDPHTQCHFTYIYIYILIYIESQYGKQRSLMASQCTNC